MERRCRSSPRRRRRSWTTCARSSSHRCSAARSAPRAVDTSNACTTSTRSPTACSTSTLASEVIAAQIKRLVRQSAIYGVGGILSRILAVLLLPLYTSYLGRAGFGKIETIVALTTVLVIVLRLGISSAFFRFYFDTNDPEQRTLVVRTSFWFTMTMATVGLALGFLFATPLAHLLRLGDDPWLVRAAFVGLWAQMNYEQLTSLFRVEERSVAFVSASIANILITVGMTVLLV